MLILRDSSPDGLARRRFGLWVLAALVVYLPVWWFWGADLAATAIRPLTGIVFSIVGLSGTIDPLPNAGWSVHTGIPLADGSGTFALQMGSNEVRRLLLTIPIFAALMSAPPFAPRPIRALVIGIVVAIVVFVVAMTLYVWGNLAALLNPDLSPDPASAIRLAASPLHPLLAQVSIIGRYIGMTVAPLLAPILLWAWLNPLGRVALLGEIRAED